MHVHIVHLKIYGKVIFTAFVSTLGLLYENKKLFLVVE